MSKVKYYYDPDTLSYRKIELGKKNRNNTIAITFSLLMTLAAGWYVGSTLKVPIIEQDTSFSKKEIKKMSGVLLELDKILLATQHQIDELVKFAGRQNNSIRKNQISADRKLVKTQGKTQRLTERILGLNEDIFELNKELESAEKALSLDKEVIASYEINTRWERMKTSMIPPLLTFFLGFFLNFVLITYSKKKITKEVEENLGFKKAAYDSGFKDLSHRHSQEIEKLNKAQAYLITELREGFRKKEGIIRKEILKKSIHIDDLKMELDKSKSELIQERELIQELQQTVKVLNHKLNPS